MYNSSPARSESSVHPPQRSLAARFWRMTQLLHDHSAPNAQPACRLRPLYSPVLMSLEWALWTVPFINYISVLFKLAYQILSHLEVHSTIIDCLFIPHYTLDWDCGAVIVLGGVMATELFGGGVFDGDEIALEQ